MTNNVLDLFYRVKGRRIEAWLKELPGEEGAIRGLQNFRYSTLQIVFSVWYMNRSAFEALGEIGRTSVWRGILPVQTRILPRNGFVNRVLAIRTGDTFTVFLHEENLPSFTRGVIASLLRKRKSQKGIESNCFIKPHSYHPSVSGT